MILGPKNIEIDNLLSDQPENGGFSIDSWMVRVNPVIPTN